MLQLTRLSGPVFALNPDLIERAEATPDTVVTLVNGSKYVIRESLGELTALIREYRAEIISAAQSTSEYRSIKRSEGHREHSGTVVALRPGEQK
ncbi:MAG TPA: flagellar FlbD family protein [Jatrophihabitans sp.]